MIHTVSRGRASRQQAPIFVQIVCTFLLAATGVGVTTAVTADERPNVLLIVVDDQSPFELQIYNPRSSLSTPNIDAIAGRGVVFDGAYHMGSTVGAVCRPSRQMIMSGRTVWHIPRRQETADPRLIPDDLPQQTLPAVFNRAGYDTMRTCKTGNSYEAANRLFKTRHDAMKRGATAESGSAWHADRVLQYLADREQASESAPFLIYLGFSHPHDPRNGTPRLLAKYGAVNHTDRSSLPKLDRRQPRLPINYLPAHPFPHGHPDLRDEVRVEGVWENRDVATIRNELGRQFACSENIDIQIGRVLTRLEEMGELENTYVVYAADHGMAIGRHGLQGKQNLYEHTWRVPLIMQGPGIRKGQRVQGNVYLLDLLATLCDLCQIDVPETNEGQSWKPVLDGAQQTVREVLYGVYCGGTKPGIRSVRRGDWKLIQYDVLQGQVRETQLFNVAENPHEFIAAHRAPPIVEATGHQPLPTQTNLADQPEFADLLGDMKRLLLAEMRRWDDPYRLWDQPREQTTR